MENTLSIDKENESFLDILNNRIVEKYYEIIDLSKYSQVNSITYKDTDYNVLVENNNFYLVVTVEYEYYFKSDKYTIKLEKKFKEWDADDIAYEMLWNLEDCVQKYEDKGEQEMTEQLAMNLDEEVKTTRLVPKDYMHTLEHDIKNELTK